MPIRERSYLVATLLVVLLLGACDRCRPEGSLRVDGGRPSPRRAQVVSLAVGGHHACALHEDGEVTCWGANSAGQLGDGTTDDRPAPVSFRMGSKASAVQAGFAATCAVTLGGERLCAGRTLLEDQEVARLRPSALTGLSGVEALGLARLHGCALSAQGQVACWGSDHFGQLGDGAAPGCPASPAAGEGRQGEVPGVSTARSIAMGDTGSCALLEGGTVRCWGALGVLETATTRPRCAPVSIPGLQGVKQVVVGSHHGCALLASGEVWCWGADAIGQLGRGEVAAEGHGAGRVALREPAPVVALDDVDEIASFGRAHSCARRRTGQVLCWGRNVEGQLGDGTTTSRRRPVVVLEDAVALGVGYDFSCALRREGPVLCWGANDHGQLGDGSTRRRTSPVEVTLGRP